MTAYLGLGTKLERDQPAMPGTWDQIGQVQSISGPSSTSEQVDVTTLDSPAGYREFIAGFKDGGELTFDVIFDPAATGFALLNSDFESQQNRNYRIEFPDSGGSNGTIWTFPGTVTGRQASIPTDDAIKANFTIKVAGAIVETPAA